MPVGIVGTKCGMSRVFMESGRSVPVTVIRALPNRVASVRKYGDAFSVQVGWGKARRRSRKSELGQFGKAGIPVSRGLREFRLHRQQKAESAESIKLGAELGVDQFNPGDRVDVTGASRGKGFAGTVKRWNFSMQDATHGNSLSHRAPGSIGQCQFPGKVWKGKKMAGQMGNVRVTVQNLEIVQVDSENHLLLVVGAVPGAPGSEIELRPSLKPRGRSLLADDSPVSASSKESAAPAEEAAEAAPEAAASEEAEAKAEPAAEASTEAVPEAAASEGAEAKAEPAAEASAEAAPEAAASEEAEAKEEPAAEASAEQTAEAETAEPESGADDKADKESS